MGRIVVGIDGSEGSRRALCWAAEEAAARGWTLTAVTAVPDGDLAHVSPIPGARIVPLSDYEERAADAAAMLDRTVHETLGSLPRPTDAHGRAGSPDPDTPTDRPSSGHPSSGHPGHVAGPTPDPGSELPSGSGPVVERQVLAGDAADALLRAADDADLLVLGARGLGPVRALMLGSVSQRCITAATLPVVIIPPAADTPTAVTAAGQEQAAAPTPAARSG